MEWLELAASLDIEPGARLRMQADWLRECGPLPCDRCGRPIEAGQLFTLTAHCLIGGTIPLGPSLAHYSDTLELRATHDACPP